MRPALCLLSLALLPGCFLSRSHLNQPIAPETVERIVPSTTTAGEVAELLGAPLEVVQLGYKSAWRYEFTVEKQAALFLFLVGLRGVDNQADRVWVFFDEEGVVSHVGSTFAADEAGFDLPWSPFEDEDSDGPDSAGVAGAQGASGPAGAAGQQ